MPSASSTGASVVGRAVVASVVGSLVGSPVGSPAGSSVGTSGVLEPRPGGNAVPSDGAVLLLVDVLVDVDELDDEEVEVDVS